MNKLTLSTLVLAASVSWSAASSAATEIKVGGQLTGYENIEVNGSFFNVEFTTNANNITSSFKNYNATSLTTQTFSLAATNALETALLASQSADQSLFDASLQNFSINSENKIYIDTIYGFDGVEYQATGVELTPPSTNTWEISNWDDESLTIQPEQYGYYAAKWTQVSPVPVPAAALMFAPALLGFMALRRKKTA